MPSLSALITGRLPRIAAALASGFVLSLAFAPHNVSLIVWVWMLPLLVALRGSHASLALPLKKRLLGGFGLGWIAGLAFFVPNLAWVRHSSRVINGALDERWMGWPVEFMGWAAALGLASYLALYWGLWAAFVATVGRPRIGDPSPGKDSALFSLSLESLRAAFLNAAAWTGLEWLRGILLTGFGWNGLGVPLASELALVQAADVVGVTGLSFLPVFCGCIAFHTALRFREEARTARVRPHLDFFCAVALVLADFIYGFRILSAAPSKDTVPLRVLLVQQNIAQATKWSHRQDDEIYQGYGRLTDLFAGRGATAPVDLVVWPESALPLPFHDPRHARFLNDVLALGDFSLLSGVDFIEPGQPNYTGAALMRGTIENHQLYRKVQLVPFGEYLPFRRFALMDKILGGVIPGDFESGTSTEPLKLEKPAGVLLAPLVCFEDTFGRFARRFIVPGKPMLLVNCTNDGWFLHSEENEQHLANARFRCIELRRPMVRAANTGVSCVIGSDGRIRPENRLADAKSGSVFIKGALPRDLALEKSPPWTFYARHGDICSISLLAIAGLAAGFSAFRGRLTGNA